MVNFDYSNPNQFVLFFLFMNFIGFENHVSYLLVIKQLSSRQFEFFTEVLFHKVLAMINIYFLIEVSEWFCHSLSCFLITSAGIGKPLRSSKNVYF